MITFKLEDRVGEIVIDRPEAGNAVTGAMARRMAELLRQHAHDAEIVTLTGAGADFTLGRDRKEPKPASPFDAFAAVADLNAAIAAFPGILIAAVRGRAFGLGVGLVMRADIALAADDARFGLDEVSHGIPPMFIMEQIVAHLPAKQALDIVLSGRVFSAAEALEIGLLSRVIPAAEFASALHDYVASLRARDPRVVLACKSYLRAVGRMPAEARPAFALVEQTQFALGRP